jgi:phosphoheptose isomerase/glycosyltransferase involved in cell wall biosynthesis
MRRIAIISEHASPIAPLGGVNNGGQNVYVAHVARNLAALGYAVDIFTRKDHASLPGIKEWERGIRIVYVPAGPAAYVPKEELFQHMDLFADYVIDFFAGQEIAYDLVHANFWMSGWVAMQIKKKLAVPFVITFHALGRVRRIHQGDDDRFPDIRFEIEDRITAEADRIIAECPQDKEDLLTLYHANAEKISIVPCGFDRDELSPVDQSTARRLLGLPQKERIILQLGRMVPRKGVDNVIRGLARLVHEYHLTTRLLIVGGEADEPGAPPSPELQRLKEIAEEEGVSKYVTFVGQKSREELKYYYSAADVFISTPWYEPFGITPVESMACGTPVIGSNVGGIQYTVVDGKTGYLVEPDDPDQLASRLADLFNRPVLLHQFGLQGIRRANQHFTWEKVTGSIAGIYEEVIGQVTEPVGLKTEAYHGIQMAFLEAAGTLERTQHVLSDQIIDTARLVTNCFRRGNKVMVCGNGGSAADAQHFAGEFVAQFQRPGRKALPVIALNADPVVLTAWANDTDFDEVFARQVEAFAHPGDILIGISTSGRSRNVLRAFEAARKRDVTCIALTGKDGGQLVRAGNAINMVVPSGSTARIQEAHMLILHLVTELVENGFTSNGKSHASTYRTNGRSYAREENPAPSMD